METLDKYYNIFIKYIKLWYEYVEKIDDIKIKQKEY
jgi:hypothetical protein